MNDKKAKALRRAARKATVGKPAVAYASRSINDRTLRLRDDSTRGAYQKMKKKAR